MAAPHKLDGLIAWTRREEWREPLPHCLDRHTAKVCAAAGIDVAEIEDLLGACTASAVWGAAFDDLLATDLPGGCNLAEKDLRFIPACAGNTPPCRPSATLGNAIRRRSK